MVHDNLRLWNNNHNPSFKYAKKGIPSVPLLKRLLSFYQQQQQHEVHFPFLR